LDNTERFGNSMPNDDPDGDGIAFVFELRFLGRSDGGHDVGDYWS